MVTTPVFLPGSPRVGGAWWAAVSGVAQSQTRLKQLSSSSSIPTSSPSYWPPWAMIFSFAKLVDVPPACSESGWNGTEGPLRLCFAVVMWDASLWSSNMPGEVLASHINSRKWRDSMRTYHLKMFKSENHITWVKWVLTRTPLLQSLSSGSTTIGQT